MRKLVGYTVHQMTLGLKLIKLCVMKVKPIAGCLAARCHLPVRRLNMPDAIVMIKISPVGKTTFLCDRLLSFEKTEFKTLFYSKFLLYIKITERLQVRNQWTKAANGNVKSMTEDTIIKI